MKKIFLFLILINLTNRIFPQSLDFIYGAWSDSTKESKGGFGYIFTPDSCCSFIINGDIVNCKQGETKVFFKVDFKSNPKQININFIDFNTHSLKNTIPMIFEIIDSNHIRICMNKDLISRPIDFNQNPNQEIILLTKFIEKR